ncbi:MAG: ATP-binding cassette domain-containing protein [Candidatus Limnocylindrales bacterium]
MALRFDGVRFAYSGGWPWSREATRVFEGFTWELPAGRTVLLGPNGAGKSTLLGLGATALAPVAGSVSAGGCSSATRRGRAGLRRAVGWMPQQVRPISGLTCREQVAYAGWLKGAPRGSAWESALDALDRVDLRPEAGRRATQVSGGQLRRLGLAQALVHRADVLLLDEPTAGLDPNQRARFREVLREVSATTPVLVSTHQVDDLTDLFDTVVVMDHGRIRFEGTPAEFTALAPAGSARPAEAAYGTLVSGD